jgi:hypothetical protein
LKFYEPVLGNNSKNFVQVQKTIDDVDSEFDDIDDLDIDEEIFENRN